MVRTRDSAMCEIRAVTVAVSTQEVVFGTVVHHEPISAMHDEGDVKTTKTGQANIGLGAGKIALGATGIIARERHYKGRAINFGETCSSVEWVHSFEGHEDRKKG